MTRLRAAIIGTGFIGGVHARAVHAAGGEVTAVVARSRENAERSAHELRAGRASTSPDAVIEADDVDVVHICTPNHVHAALAEKALKAGKHVVCEKPLATTAADAERLASRAAEAGVVAAVPFVYRFYPTVREARERIATGEAGALWMLHGSYLQDWMSRGDDTNWRADPALGGASRAFADIGVHWCDLMEFVTGHRIARLVSGMATAFPGGEGTEDGAAVLFETDRGALGSVVASQVSPGRKNRLWFSFDGTDASYSFDQENPDSLWVGGRDVNGMVPRGPDTLSAAAARYVTVPAGHPQGYQDAFTAFVADVYRASDGEEPEGLPRFADGLRAARITDAVVQSARSRTWVEVPT